MTYLVAAVAILGVVSLLNLLLVLAVLRRLRADVEDTGSAHVVTARGLLRGSRPGAFLVRTLDDGPLTQADLAGGGPTLIGFFSPGCGPCAEALPSFAARAANWPGGPERVLAVIADETEVGAEFAAPLTGLARVVVDGLDGPVATAFGVGAFPNFGILDGTAMVSAESNKVEALPAEVHTPAAA